MQPSLLTMRKHLKLLTWLLGFALLVSVSPHLAQGLVLCIGDGHVAVEAPGPINHTARANAAADPSGAAGLRAADGSAFEEGGAPCIDVPLRVARSSNLCHQAVQSDAPRADVLLPETLLSTVTFPPVSSTSAAQEAAAPPRPSSDVPAASSPSALGSVVLLI